MPFVDTLSRMSVFDHVADATVRVVAGNSSGTGFHVHSPSIVITNSHVVGSETNVHVFDERGHIQDGVVRVRSDAPDEDWAVIVLTAPLPEGGSVLNLATKRPSRGDEVIFAGYPHAHPDLLTHSARVSGWVDHKGFHLDGSVNGGNSGGPVVDATTGDLVGIVSARRMLHSLDLGKAANQGAELIAAANSFAQTGSVIMMGIDVAQLYRHIGATASLARDVAIANANSGIGIAFWPDSAVEAASNLA